jgi:Fic family protein
MYNWQYKEWANFTYNSNAISEIASIFLEKLNEADIVLQNLSVSEQQEELIRFMISEATKTSEIEGEFISRQDLMSSIKNRLGLNISPEIIKDKRAVAVANLLVVVRNSYDNKFSEAEIKKWHKLLFENSKNINAGKWRTGIEPMQVVSGAIGKEIVHYEAPPSYRIPAEIKQFVHWYNSFKVKDNIANAIIKTAISHLYFESIHPFEDGNGRIGRAIAEKCLAQSLGRPILLSLSSVIEKNKKDYYAALKNTQNSLEVTDWIAYFANVIMQAQVQAIEIIKFSLQKSKFFTHFQSNFNERELKVINKMFDAGAEGFEGGITARKYISITKTSKPTATRDLQHLSKIGALLVSGEGRSVHYNLNIRNV